MIDYAAILTHRYPDTEWTLNGDDYEGLTWNSAAPKPSKAELDDLWEEVKVEIADKAAQVALNKEALLSRLGITAEEARLLLS